MLSYEEYRLLVGEPVDLDIFEKLIKPAERVISAETRRFYKYKDFETDVKWRKEAYKEALAYQVDYFSRVGSSNEMINSIPQSVSLGRTTITQAGRNGANEENSKPVVCLEAIQALLGTGLLHRGV